MSREIKFRGKRIDNGQWSYGYLVIDENGEVSIVNNYGKDSYTWDEVDPETVGQYTGLKDQNGKEVYEGDVVKQTYHAVGRDEDNTLTSFDGHHIGVVSFLAGKGVVMKNPLRYAMETNETTVSKLYKNISSRRAEVIGNKYEHPHLLEVSP